MELNLENKVALITGGTHGIGKAIALSFAREKCSIATFSRNEDRVRETLNELSILLNKDKLFMRSCDAVDKTESEKFIKSALDYFGKIDILINNLGGGGSWGKEIIEETEYRIWEEVYNKNVGVAAHFTMALISSMLKNKFGRVITISSTCGVEGDERPWFCLAKSAEISLMKSLSLNSRYASNNITFNTIAPGYVDIKDTYWDKMKKEQPEEYQKVLSVLPFKRLIVVEEIADLVVFLCSDKASGINGQCIRVDGGFTRSF